MPLLIPEAHVTATLVAAVRGIGALGPTPGSCVFPAALPAALGDSWPDMVDRRPAWTAGPAAVLAPGSAGRCCCRGPVQQE